MYKWVLGGIGNEIIPAGLKLAPERKTNRQYTAYEQLMPQQVCISQVLRGPLRKKLL